MRPRVPWLEPSHPASTSRRCRVRPRTGYVLGLGLVIAATAAALAPLAGAAEEDPAAPQPSPPAVVRVRVNTIIHPVASELLRSALDEADRSGAQALVLELSTPGGLLDSTREMFTAMLAAEVPVIAYVAPQGAQAASAGFFLLQAADIAAMAPGTNTGAAHPVGGQGETIEGDLGKKVEEDAAATIRSLASRHGRNLELAQSAVVESRSFTAAEALEGGLIDLIADDLDALLEAVDGRTVTKNGTERVLHTAGATLREVEMTTFQRWRSVLVHPNVAYLLMTLGGLGIYFELANPGSIFPGVLGAICLILAFYALSVLPVNYAGVALIVLSAFLFLLEIKVTSFGILTAGGVAALVLGSILLFRTADPALRVSIEVIAAVAVVATGVAVLLTTVVVRAHRRQATTGREGMVRARGVARTDLEPRGKVSVHGEIWDAVAASPIHAGQEVEVVAVDGLLLRVEPTEG